MYKNLIQQFHIENMMVQTPVLDILKRPFFKELPVVLDILKRPFFKELPVG